MTYMLYWFTELYEICRQRAEERLHSMKDTDGSDSDSLASFSGFRLLSISVSFVV